MYTITQTLSILDVLVPWQANRALPVELAVGPGAVVVIARACGCAAAHVSVHGRPDDPGFIENLEAEVAFGVEKARANCVCEEARARAARRDEPDCRGMGTRLAPTAALLPTYLMGVDVKDLYKAPGRFVLECLWCETRAPKDPLHAVRLGWRNIEPVGNCPEAAECLAGDVTHVGTCKGCTSARVGASDLDAA